MALVPQVNPAIKEIHGPNFMSGFGHAEMRPGMARVTGPEFGTLLRKHRVRVGLTQRELADLSTISVRAIRDLEQGKASRPRPNTVRLIADGLRLTRQARVELELAANNGTKPRTDYDHALAPPPIAMDAIIGREAEAAALERELSDGQRRFVNVVGLSGVGKSRLTLEVATRIHGCAKTPVLWTAAPGTTPVYDCALRDERLSAIAQAGVSDLFGCTVRADLAELIADRKTLLVIDGADAHSPRPEPLMRLLQDCPKLCILITSVRPHGLPGERTFLLPTLRTPASTDERDATSLARVPAVRLFLDHARPVQPDYRLTQGDVPLVAEICSLLDGLPRALIAAAPWLALYGPERLLQTLRDDPAGLADHGELAQSLAELPAAEQDLLGRLRHTSGVFTVDDVVALTGLSLPDAGRSLRRLLVHGVVRSRDAQGAFQVLNLVRAQLGRDFVPSSV